MFNVIAISRKKTGKILCKQVLHKCVDSCAWFLNQNGLNSQHAIELGGYSTKQLEWWISKRNSCAKIFWFFNLFLLCPIRVNVKYDLILRYEVRVKALRASSLPKMRKAKAFYFSQSRCSESVYSSFVNEAKRLHFITRATRGLPTEARVKTGRLC